MSCIWRLVRGIIMDAYFRKQRIVVFTVNISLRKAPQIIHQASLTENCVLLKNA